MAKSKPSVAARFDPDPKHYLLTKVEFERLCEVARIPEKENFLFLCGLLIPCAFNVYAEFPATGASPGVAFVMNFIVVVLAGLLAVFQGRSWYSKRKAFKSFIGELEDRPEGRLAFTEPKTGVFVSGGGGPGVAV